MKTLAIGMLHPGEMGASVGAAARAAGAPVAWVSAHRSAGTRRRAEGARLEDAGTLPALTAQSDIIISVCPPEAAARVAREVAETHFSGIYVDANAVSRDTALEVGAIVEESGATFVDGGIIGPPPERQGTTRLYLSGREAAPVASAFEGSALEAVVIGPHCGAASALKMCYAAWTKGSAALLTAIRALAQAEQVETALMQEWALSQPGLESRSAGASRDNAPKAWRFAGEMREIAASFDTAGLPAGFHEAAADVYSRLARYKDCESPPALEHVLDAVLREGTA